MSKIDRRWRLFARAGRGFLDAVRGSPQLVVMSAIWLQLRVDHFLEHGFFRCGWRQCIAWHDDLTALVRKDQASRWTVT
jgi:hypothetical protein